MLQEKARHAGVHGPDGISGTHTGRDHQDFASKADVPRLFEKRKPVLVAKIEVEQDEIGCALSGEGCEGLERFRAR